MARNNKSANKTILIMEGVMFVVVGILFCCSVNAGYLLNVFIGIVLLIAGLFSLGSCMFLKRTTMAPEGLVSAFIIALGVLCFIEDLHFIELIILFMIVLGSIFLADGLLGLSVFKRRTVPMVTEMVIGVFAFVLGMCLWFIPSFGKFAEIVMGAILIIAGLFYLVSALYPKAYIVIDD